LRFVYELNVIYYMTIPSDRTTTTTNVRVKQFFCDVITSAPYNIAFRGRRGGRCVAYTDVSARFNHVFFFLNKLFYFIVLFGDGGGVFDALYVRRTNDTELRNYTAAAAKFLFDPIRTRRISKQPVFVIRSHAYGGIRTERARRLRKRSKKAL